MLSPYSNVLKSTVEPYTGHPHPLRITKLQNSKLKYPILYPYVNFQALGTSATYMYISMRLSPYICAWGNLYEFYLGTTSKLVSQSQVLTQSHGRLGRVPYKFLRPKVFGVYPRAPRPPSQSHNIHSTNPKLSSPQNLYGLPNLTWMLGKLTSWAKYGVRGMGATWGS